MQGPLIVQEKASSGTEHVQMMVAEMEGTKVTVRLCSICACVQECMQLWLMTKAGVHHASCIKEDTMVRKWDSIKIMRQGGRCGAWGGCIEWTTCGGRGRMLKGIDRCSEAAHLSNEGGVFAGTGYACPYA